MPALSPAEFSNARSRLADKLFAEAQKADRPIAYAEAVIEASRQVKAFNDYTPATPSAPSRPTGEPQRFTEKDIAAALARMGAVAMADPDSAGGAKARALARRIYGFDPDALQRI